MKALVIHGPRDLRYETVQDPAIIDSRDVIVKMKQCGICGSDLHLFDGELSATPRPVFGIGHEAIGEVVETGRDVQDLKAGDMVMLAAATGCGICRPCLSGQIKCCENHLMQVYGIGAGLDGCQAEAIRVPAGDFNAARIPEGISHDQAILLTDNLPTAYGACIDADIRPGRTVAVIGLGPIGLMAVELAFIMGASAVYAIDLVPERRERAAELGATALPPQNVAEVLREVTGGRMVDCVVEAVGGDVTMSLALSIVRIAGNVSVLGVNSSMNFRIPMDVFINGVTIRANFLTEVSKHWNDLVPLLQHGRIRPENVITNRSSLANGIDAYIQFEGRTGGVLKTMLVP